MSDLIRAQNDDHAVKCLKLLVAGWQGLLPHCDGRLATKVKSYYFKYKGLFVENNEGILMRRRRPTELTTHMNDLVILPALFQMEALHLAHDAQCHIGQTKVIHVILQKFDWPGMQKDVARYINSCLTCQSSKPPKKKTRFPLRCLESGSPNELLQIDHLKLTTTKNGYKGVLMMIDHFTKFAQAIPYVEFDSEETCQILLNHWIEPHGAPLAIQSDNGPQFASQLTTEMMKHLDILQIHSSPYHPQTNGLVERQNRTLILLLRTVCSRRQDDWDALLVSAMSAYNSTRHSSTGFSPHLLWFGRERRTPLMLLFPKREKGFMSCKQYLKKMFRRSAKIQQMTRANLREAQVRQKRNFDKDATHLYPYKPGERVLVSVKVIPRGGVGKLLRSWRGPCEVRETKQGGRWYILENGMITHYERLKPYIPRVTDMEVESPLPQGEEEVADPQECADNELIPPEEEISDQGTFDGETDSEMSFELPDPAQIPPTDRELRPRKRIDYYKAANPDEFQLFSIAPSSILRGVPMMNVNALQEMDYAERQYRMSNRDEKVVSWMESCELESQLWKADVTPRMQEQLARPREDCSTSTISHGEVMDLESYCRRIHPPPHLHRPIYSRVIQYLAIDFLNCSLPMAVAATADFRMSSGLSAALNLELQNRGFLFSQQCSVGEVASMPRFGSRTHRRIYYLVLRVTEQSAILLNDAENCVYDLLCRAKANGEASLAVPLVDKWRDPLPWDTWYRLLHDNFLYSGIQLLVPDHYYLTVT